jgi:hypothetical protein
VTDVTTGGKQKAQKQNSFSSVRKRCQPLADGKGDIMNYKLSRMSPKTLSVFRLPVFFPPKETLRVGAANSQQERILLKTIS